MKTFIAALILALAVPAYAQDEPGPTTIGYWYANLTGDSRSARNFAIITFAIAVDATAYGMAVEFNKQIDGEMADARYEVIIACFRQASREDAADGFASWAVNQELSNNMPLGAAVTLFVNALCHVNDSKT